MAQIMKADGAQTVFLQQLRELLGNIIGAEDVPDLVHTQIAEIVWIVAAAAQTAVGLLLTFQLQQTVTDGRHQRQGAQTGFGFCTVGLNKDFFAVNGCLCDDTFDLHCIGFKVDGIPFQPQHLAAAQAIEGCQKDRYLQFGSICRLGQGVDLFGSVVAAFEIVLFRTFDLICRV